jgi:putative FmdB family regulatory protein
MIYRYFCKVCNKETDISKPMMEASKEEKCNKCHSVLKRIYTASSVKTSDGIKL